MRIKLILAVTVLLCGICSFSCRKSATADNDFTYTGLSLIGDSIKFIATAPYGSLLKWSFGDGDSAGGYHPVHVYRHAGLFDVVLTIYLGKVYLVKKTIYIDTMGLSYSGTLLTGNEITFKASGAGRKNFMWRFESNATATGSMPKHVFAAAGTYNVQLTINDSFTLRKTLKVSDDPILTPQICHALSWHHLSSISESWGAWPDTTRYSDTVFAINYIDQLNVSIGMDTLGFLSKNNTNLYFYSDRSVPSPPYRSVDASTITYNYITGMVEYKIENTLKNYVTYTVYTSF